MFLVKNYLNFTDLKKFLFRRWFRTLPLYYLILMTLLILTLIITNKVSFKWQYFLFLNNFTSKPSAFFGETWSLSIEEWFYILFSLLLFITSVTINSKKIVSKERAHNFFGCVLKKYDDMFTIVIFRLDAIAYGILAYWLFYNFRIVENKIFFLFSLSFILIFIAAIIRFKFSDLTIVGITYYLFAGLGYAALVLALYICRWKNKWRIVSHISRISYSIYITHLSLLLLPLIKLFQPATLLGKVIFMVVYTIITYLSSLFTYTVIEMRFNKIRDRYYLSDKELIRSEQ